MTRADRLMTFLTRLNDQPVIWGETDCSSAPALWVAEEKQVLHIPLPKWSSRDEAHALIAKGGGLVNLWDEALSGILFERSGNPQIGDVGIIDTRVHGPMGVICFEYQAIRRHEERGWAWITPRDYLKVWALD